MKRIVVLGAGIAGLAAAHRARALAAEGGEDIEVIVLEASARAGGCIATTRVNGAIAELGPDAFVRAKPAARELLARLSLTDHVIEQAAEFRGARVVRGHRLAPIPSGFRLFAPTSIAALVRSRLFSPFGMARAACAPLLPADNGRPDESVASFVTRRFGREVLDRLAQPLLGGIYSGDPRALSVRATLPFMLTRARSPSPAAHELVSLRHGLGSMVDALRDELHDSLRLGTRAIALRRFGDKWIVATNNGDEIVADALICAIPAYAAATLLQPVAPELAHALNEIPYTSVATTTLAYESAAIPTLPRSTGFIVPAIEKRSVMSVTFSSQKFAGRAPHGTTLMRAFVGGALQGDLLDLDDDVLERLVSDDLRDLLGITATPLWRVIKRWNNALPEYRVGHIARVENIERAAESLPSFALAGSAYRGAGIPDCIASGERAAATCLSPRRSSVSISRSIAAR